MSACIARAWHNDAQETSRKLERRGKGASRQNAGRRGTKKTGCAPSMAVGSMHLNVSEQPCTQPSSCDSWRSALDVPQGIKEIWTDSVQHHNARSSSLASGHSTSSTASADTLDSASAVASLPFTPHRRDALFEQEFSVSAWQPDPLVGAPKMPWAVAAPPGLEIDNSDPFMWAAYDVTCSGFDTGPMPWIGDYSGEWEFPAQSVYPFPSHNPAGRLQCAPPPPPLCAAPQMVNAQEATPPPDFQASVPGQTYEMHAGLTQHGPADLPLRSPVRFEGCPTRAPASALEQARFRSILSKAGLL